MFCFEVGAAESSGVAHQTIKLKILQGVVNDKHSSHCSSLVYSCTILIVFILCLLINMYTNQPLLIKQLFKIKMSAAKIGALGEIDSSIRLKSHQSLEKLLPQ